MQVNQHQSVNGENGVKIYAVGLVVEVSKEEYVFVNTPPIKEEVNA